MVRVLFIELIINSKFERKMIYGIFDSAQEMVCAATM